MKAKGWSGDDKALRQSIAHRIVSIMHRHAQRGDVVDARKRAGVRVWRAAG